MHIHTRPLLAACALGAVAVVATPAGAATELTFTTSGTPTSPASLVLEDWADTIAERTDGEVTVEFYYQQSLSKLADNLEAVSSGLADIGIIVPAYSKQDLPLTYLSSTSYASGDPYAVATAWMETREAFPAIQEEEEEAGLKFLAVNSIGPTLFVGDRFYTSPEDFAGATMRLSSHYSRAAQQFGWDVSPARIRSPETYTALEKGTITGSTTYANQIYPFKLNEVADHVTTLNLGQHANMIYASLDTWESLSEEHRQAIEETLPQLTEDLAKAEIQYAEETLGKIEADPTYPVKVMRLEGEERDAWADALRGSYEANVEEASAINPTAAEIAERYMAEIDDAAGEVEASGYPWSQ
ncbi:TRAP transporter substrate-binding protein DctP [Acuticoccus sp.]|uniref:TRAP transporter substrate-binding protein DctP n=1 Tax=Acuticoccus sp. TaxID=1904378 RepID=UPI003B526F3E